MGKRASVIKKKDLIQVAKKQNISLDSSLSYGKIIDSKTDEKTYAFDALLEAGYKKEVKNIIWERMSKLLVGFIISWAVFLWLVYVLVFKLKHKK